MLETSLNFMHEISKENHPLYYPNQFFQFAAFSCLGTAALNLTRIISTPPIHGMSFFTTAWLASKVATPLFTILLKPYSSNALALKAHKFLRLTTALFIAKITCGIFGISLGISQILLISGAIWVAYYLMRIALSKFWQSRSPLPISPWPQKTITRNV